MEYQEDFTLEHYRNILEGIKNKFLISTVAEMPTVVKNQTLILRHDMDISPKAAHMVAELEHALGINTTYYVLLHSPFYNALDRKNLNYIREIKEMGHEVGLHFDSHFWGIETESELEGSLLFEKKLLEKYFDIQVKSFSFHLTTPFTKMCNKKEYGGLINAFSSFFQNDAVYCSDSFGIWRFKRLYDYIMWTKEPLVQILTHPEWWIFNSMSASDRIKQHLKLMEVELLEEAEKNYIYKSERL